MVGTSAQKKNKTISSDETDKEAEPSHVPTIEMSVTCATSACCNTHTADPLRQPCRKGSCCKVV
jgi:hypothetical protein